MAIEEIKSQEVENFKKLLRLLKQFSEDGISSSIEKQLLQLLENSITFFSNLVMEEVFPEIHRLTVNNRVIGKNKRLHEIKYLKYPPAERVSNYGRCNYPQQSILYSSLIDFTTMNEIRPKIGDLVTDSVWKVKNNQSLKYCPIFKNQPVDGTINPWTYKVNQVFNVKLEQYPKNVAEQINDLVQFVADVFTKRINTASHLDYIFSAFFANKIFNEFEDGSIEAILYPSVKNHLSFENLAIKSTVFDAKYELVEVKDSVCIQDLTDGNRGYGFLGLSDCKSFDYVSDKILWDTDHCMQPKEEMERLKKVYDIDIS